MNIVGCLQCRSAVAMQDLAQLVSDAEAQKLCQLAYDYLTEVLASNSEDATSVRDVALQRLSLSEAQLGIGSQRR